MDEILKTLNLTPDETPMIFVGALLFFLFWKVAAKTFIADFVRLGNLRESLTTGANELARQQLELASTISGEVEAELLKARIDALSKKGIIINRAQGEAHKIVQRAEDEAQEFLRNTRWQLMQQSEQIRAEAMKEGDALVDLVVSKVLSGGDSKNKFGATQ